MTPDQIDLMWSVARTSLMSATFYSIFLTFSVIIARRAKVKQARNEADARAYWVRVYRDLGEKHASTGSPDVVELVTDDEDFIQAYKEGYRAKSGAA